MTLIRRLLKLSVALSLASLAFFSLDSCKVRRGPHIAPLKDATAPLCGCVLEFANPEGERSGVFLRIPHEQGKAIKPTANLGKDDVECTKVLISNTQLGDTVGSTAKQNFYFGNYRFETLWTITKVCPPGDTTCVTEADVATAVTFGRDPALDQTPAKARCRICPVTVQPEASE